MCFDFPQAPLPIRDSETVVGGSNTVIAKVACKVPLGIFYIALCYKAVTYDHSHLKDQHPVPSATISNIA